jgi:hypothetical protein
MLTFDEMWNLIPHGAPVSVLLGNGFSRAWRDNIFQYGTLYDAASFGPRENKIRQVFDVLNTYDFEKVTSRLRSAAEIMNLYSRDRELSRQLHEDSEIIKDALLRAIIQTHPARPNEVTADEYICVRRFLSKFSNIYTVNYDLLMYWARNQRDLEPDNWETDDGFRSDHVWVGPETDQNVFFLHGALHLFQDRDGIKKHAFSLHGEPIIEAIRDNLQDNLARDVFPLFVSEPSAELKLSRINSNPYLSYCFRQLSQEEGYILIFGHQFREFDQHIFAALDRSSIGHVFVSIYGNQNSPENRRTQANARAYLQKENRGFDFVDARTVPVWQTA